jgi:DegV family protein with EDD domain
LARVQIVTDSTARFEDPRFIEDYGITVVPLSVQVGDQTYVDGVDISAEDVLHRLRQGRTQVSVSPPAADAFEQVFKELNKVTDQIGVVVHSQHLTDTFAHAQAARMSLLGRCEIIIIDSLTTSAGLGYLVETVAEAAERGSSLDDLVRTARGVIPRLYSVYYVDSLDVIQRAGLIGHTQAILGAMLDIKPILTIEDGRLITMEKARTHSQAIDKLIEFVAEFTHLERLCIVQSTPRITDRTRMLQDRLALEFARLQAPVIVYEPLIASLIGPDGMGMVVLEGTGDDDMVD